jgi:hypothetical protein
MQYVYLLRQAAAVEARARQYNVGYIMLVINNLPSAPTHPTCIARLLYRRIAGSAERGYGEILVAGGERETCVGRERGREKLRVRHATAIHNTMSGEVQAEYSPPHTPNLFAVKDTVQAYNRSIR